jgi:hypothetical protein
VRTFVQAHRSGPLFAGLCSNRANRPAPLHHQLDFSKKKEVGNISFPHRRTYAILSYACDPFPPPHACDHRELLHRAACMRPSWEPPSWGLLAAAFSNVAVPHLAPSHFAPCPSPVSLPLLLLPALPAPARRRCSCTYSALLLPLLCMPASLHLPLLRRPSRCSCSARPAPLDDADSHC